MYLPYSPLITNPYDIANTFNNYFASIAETMKKNIKYSHKHFSNETSSTIFLQPTDKEEIAYIVSSLNSNKVSGPNSIPYIVLFLLKKWNFKAISRFIQPLFHDLCFSFSKLDYSNYRPISLLSNIEKILEKLMYKRLYTFFNKNNVIYNLQFGFRKQYCLN